MGGDDGTLDIGVLGAVVVRVAGRRIPLSGRPLQVLCRLVVADGREVPPWRLLEDVWGGGTLGVLRTTVSRLRCSLGSAGGAINCSAHGYALRRDRVVVDSDRFAAEVEAAVQSVDPARLLDRLEDALQLWRGDPFESLDDAPWLLALKGRLLALHSRAIDVRSEALLASGSGPEVLQALRGLVADDPHRESSVVSLATALYRSGDQVEALRQLRSAQARLRDDLGLEPSPALTRLEHLLLTHDAALEPSADVDSQVTRSSSASIDTMARSVAGLAGAGAFDEAVRVAGRAVDLARAGERQRVVVQSLCRLARAAGLAGRGAEAVDALAEARTLARRLDDAEALAQTALAGFALGVGHVGDGSLLVELAEPLPALEPGSRTRFELLAAIIQQISLGIDTRGADAVLDEAMRHTVHSHESGAGEALHTTIMAGLLSGLRGHRNRGVSAHPDADSVPRPSAASDTDQLVDDALRLGRPSLELAARLAQLRASMLAGRLDDVVRNLPELEAVARRGLAPAAVLRTRIAGSAVALAQARFDGLERQITETSDLGRRMGVSSASGSTNLQLLTLAVEFERYEHVAAIVEQARVADPRGIVWDAVDAYLAASAGDHDRAGRLLARLADTRPWDHLIGWQALFTAALATEAAWWASAPALAEVTGPMLERDSGRFLVAGHSTVLFGPIDRYRGLAALSGGDHDQAVFLLSTARTQAAAGGALLWQRWCEVDLANAHLARQSAHGRRSASQLHDALVGSPEVACSPRLARQVQANGDRIARVTAM